MPFRITIPLILLLAFVAIGFLGGRQDSFGDPDLIKIVSSLPRSGSARGQTDTIVNGIKLAINDAGKKVEVIDPVTKQSKAFRIEYLDLDDATAAEGQWTIEQEIANANQARMDPDVMAYIGTYNSGAAKVSMPILNRVNMFMISPANTSPSLTKPGEGERHEPNCYRPTGKVNYTRVVPTDDLQAGLSARWTQDMGMKKVYILDDNEVYGKGIADLFRVTCDKLGITVLGQQSIDSKAQEFTPLMTSIKAMNPDLIYFGGTTQTKAGQLLKDLVKVGMTCPMMAPDGCFEKAMIDSAGLDTFEKVTFYATFGGLPIDALTEGKGLEFVEKYTKAYGMAPKDAYATYGYECGLAVLESIRKAGKKDREAIRSAGLGLRNFDGATGRWSFDENGDTTNQTMSGNKVIVVKKVVDGEEKKVGDFQFIKPLKLPQSTEQK